MNAPDSIYHFKLNSAHWHRPSILDILLEPHFIEIHTFLWVAKNFCSMFWYLLSLTNLIADLILEKKIHDPAEQATPH